MLSRNSKTGELETAIKRHEAGLARMVPLILSSCDWKSSPLGKLKALPRDAKPIAKWWNREDAYSDIATGICDIVKELNARRESPVIAEPPKASAANAGDDDTISLVARLSLGGQLAVLQRVGCPYLDLRLVCTSKRPAKISGAELRLRGSQYLKPFQDGFGTDFGYTPLQGKPSENDSLGIHFIAVSEPNLPGGYKIERDEACTLILPGLGFPVLLLKEADAAELSVVANFLDGREERVLSGEEAQAAVDRAV